MGRGSGGQPPGNFLKFQVYSDNFVKATITLEADHYSLLHILYAYFSRCTKMLQLAVIAVSNEKAIQRLVTIILILIKESNA